MSKPVGVTDRAYGERRPEAVESPGCLAVYRTDDRPMYCYAEAVDGRLAVVSVIHNRLTVALVSTRTLWNDIEDDDLRVDARSRAQTFVPAAVDIDGGVSR